jgi:hypothetical protein
VLVRIAYRFVALQMEIFSQYRERRERCIIARVLEVKKEIPVQIPKSCEEASIFRSRWALPERHALAGELRAEPVQEAKNLDD